ncbi:hypothetical protein ACWPM1_01600 [Tsuneonella sp. HG249]
MRLVFAALALVPAAAVANDTAPVAAPAPAARLNLDTPLETIMADPAGAALIESVAPGTAAHPQYSAFKGMSLRELSMIASDKLTPEALAKLEAALAQIK